MLQKTKNVITSLTLSSALFFGVSQNAVAEYTGSTATGLDLIPTIINTDKRLNRRVSETNIAQAAMAADAMNQILVTAIKNTGVANDVTISTADARELNDYIYANYHADWLIHHGDDDNGVETGFHLVQGNGAKTRLFGKNAINKVADGIYHLGFETHRKNRLMNEDGDKNASFKRVGEWLTNLLVHELIQGSLKNADITEVEGSTGTGLDSIINIIYEDVGLQKKISTGDMRQGAAAADGMNHIIINAIKATGVAADGTLSANDVRQLSAYIQNNNYGEWLIFHGDDENDEETGFHLVQSDGAKTKLFGKNAINKVADGIYHLGFGTNANGRRLINEDGNNNAGVRKVASWLNRLLAADLADGSLNP